MAGDSHEEPTRDLEGEEVEDTRSCHSSGDDEPPSHSPSFSGPSCSPARHLSLTIARPIPPHTLPRPLPEFNPVPQDNVRSLGMLAPRSGPWYYRACPHRGQGCPGGPPCYMCSVLDMPPKYRRREARGWQRLREKLTKLSQGTVNPLEGDRSLERGPPASVFTISEWRPNDVPEIPAVHVPASLNATPDHRRPQERDNPAFNAQDLVEGGGGASRTHSGVMPPFPSSRVTMTTEGITFVPLPPLLPSSTIDPMSPPPLLGHTSMQPFVPPQEASEVEPPTRCTRRLICQLLYSLLLATASSTLIVSYDQPVLIITSVIVFLALFVFLPIIAFMECLFRCKMEQDFRHYVQSVVATVTPPSVSALIP